MLGGAAVLAAERQALQQAQRDQQDRREPADRHVGGQQADREGRAAHHDDGDEEGVLAPDQVADAPEHQRAEGPHQEAGRVGGECRQQRRRVVALRKEEGREERRQRGVEVEVVPLENRAQGRSEDDSFLFLRGGGAQRQRAGGGRHVSVSCCFSNRIRRRLLKRAEEAADRIVRAETYTRLNKRVIEAHPRGKP